MTKLAEKLGHTLQSEALLQAALTHPSALGEKPELAADNQRLEYLGDAVLQLTISETLFRRYPETPEGKLTTMRRQLVRTETLAAIAQELGLGDYLILGKGEELNDGRHKPKLLADALEAIFGAIYLDAGGATAQEVILRLMATQLDALEPETVGGNPKGALQEKLQADGAFPPEYRIENAAGPPHARRYVASVHWAGKELARGEGSSKKEAEIAAAAEALQVLTTTAEK